MSTHKLHADEVDINLTLVKQLVALQFPHWASLPVNSIHSTGTDNAIYRLGDDMVLRFPRIKEAAAHIDKEYQWLPTLALHLPLPIPVPIAKATWMCGRGWALCFGVVALPYYEKTNPTLAKSARKAINEVLAE